ncbi:unnamed protein product [Dovyalis caffra]|uniref:Voltage-dependent anion-selective channel n=1 Tax=Dovyalis caffra TaxID=77055 RepID=A0AAV1RAC1_9ROSI|nr:unnamed protein product [Dovyalis caffra]
MQQIRYMISSSATAITIQEAGLLDLVAGGYREDHNFSISTCSNTGVKITSHAVKHGRFSTQDVAAQYHYKDATINVKADLESKSPISATLTLSRKFLPSLNTTASLKLPNYNSSTLRAQYFPKHAGLAMSVSLYHTSKIQLSASVGTSSFAFGIQTEYNITSKQFREFDAGISMTKPNHEASITMGNKGDFLRASYIHYFDRKKKVAAAAVISRRFSKKENTLIVGGSWIMDNLTTVKARFDYHGKMKMLLQHKIKPKSRLTVSSEFDTKAINKIPGIGLTLSLVL